jgi:hypothetical protein
MRYSLHVFAQFTWQYVAWTPRSIKAQLCNTGMGQRDAAMCNLLIFAGGCPCSTCRSAMALLCNVPFSHNAALQCTRCSVRRMHGVATAICLAAGRFGRLCCSCSAGRQPTVLAALVSSEATRCRIWPSASSPFCGLVTSESRKVWPGSKVCDGAYPALGAGLGLFIQTV